MPINTVIFDLFGTLCTSPEDPTKELFKIIAKENRMAVRRMLLTQHIPSVAGLSNYLTSQVNVHEYDSRIAQAAQQVALYADTTEILKELRAQGKKIGLISNLGSMFCQTYTHLRLQDLIEQAVFSCEIGFEKPEPEIYLHACAKLNAFPAEVLMVGNSYKNDAQGARNIGMRAAYIDRSGQSAHEHITSLEGIRDYL